MAHESDPRGQGAVALPALRPGLFSLSCAVLLLAIGPGVARAQNDHWQVGTASSLFSGRYGTDSRTAVVYTPITARRLFTDGDLTLVVPFTCIRGDGSVTVVNGSPVRNERIANSGLTGRTDENTRGERTTPQAAVGSDAVASATTCGLGDVVVRGRYYVLDESRWFPTIAVRAHLKTATADAERGLGTGRSDEGIGIEVTRTLAGGSLAMIDAGYTVIGKPAGVSFQNNWWYDVGISQDLAGGTVNLGLFFEQYRAILPGIATARGILAALTLKRSAGWRLQVSGQFGLSDSAPDHGLTLGASRRF